MNMSSETDISALQVFIIQSETNICLLWDLERKVKPKCWFNKAKGKVYNV